MTGLGYIETGLTWIAEKTGVDVSSELWFNLYVKGSVSAILSVDFINPKKVEASLSASLAIGIELGFKLKAVIERMIIISAINSDGSEGEVQDETSFETELSGDVSAGFTGTGSGGVDAKGHYIKATVSFNGMVLKVVGKLITYNEVGKPKKESINKSWTIIKPKPDILNENLYVF